MWSNNAVLVAQNLQCFVKTNAISLFCAVKSIYCLRTNNTTPRSVWWHHYNLKWCILHPALLDNCQCQGVLFPFLFDSQHLNSWSNNAVHVAQSAMLCEMTYLLFCAMKSTQLLIIILKLTYYSLPWLLLQIVLLRKSCVLVMKLYSCNPITAVYVYGDFSRSIYS